MESRQAADFLVGLPDTEFVLHGSPHLLTTLEPRQAHCGSGEPGSNLRAVYATIVVECALVRALVRGDPDQWGWRYEGKGDQKGLAVFGKGLRLERGHVYVLPIKKFARVEGTLWWVAFEPVAPTCRVSVGPTILRCFPEIFFESLAA